jgi:carbon-monoxide dehydrogenase large subunit
LNVDQSPLFEATRFGSGQSVARMEDDALLRGQGRFTDDWQAALPELAEQALNHLAFVRSPYAHARIVSIDATAARAMPGVLLVLTGQEMVDAGCKPLAGVAGFTRAGGAPAAAAPRRALAHERVRFVGEPVVAVVAQTREQARDAAEAVSVDYEELPAVVDLAGALAGRAVLCEGADDNIVAESRYGKADQAAQAFAQATHVVALDLDNQRLAALTLEPRSVLASWQASGERLIVRLSSQMPSGARNSIADVIGLARPSVRVVVGDVGGGFGMKTGAYPEDIVTAFCAHRLQGSVKWIADRSEEFLATTHGRDLHTCAELALDAHGKVLALRVRSDANVGAYPTGTGVAIALLIGPWVLTGVYDIQLIDYHFRAVMTNTMSTAAYRGAGRPESIHIIERLMDEAARQTGIDRIELRRRNFIAPDRFPYKNAMGQVYDVGAFESIMDQGLKLADWSGFEARAADSARRGKWRGLGIATFLEWTGGNQMEERVTLSVQADGTIEVFSAVMPMGQGIATTLAQLVVDAFGVPIDRVRVILGDTDRGDGFGSAGSRSLFTGGSAMKVGADRTIAHGKALAAKEFEAAEQDIVYEGGRFSVAGTDVSIGLFDLAGKQADQRIFMDSTSAASGPSWPNGCHITEVELDPASGQVEVVAYASVNDVGRVVNPTIVRGQLDGGAVQGIGQALQEAVVYDEQTGQLLTGSLMDYTAPRAGDCPHFKTEMDQSVPSTNNPLGVKGVGELGTIGATPAVVNAVADALARAGRSDLAPRLQMPLTPARLWELMAGH